MRIILERMNIKLQDVLSKSQAGFRPNRGTRDQVTNLKILMDKSREFNQPLYLCFVDFVKAFDTVYHDKLWKTMLEFGFSKHIVKLLMKLYVGQRAIVKVAQTCSEEFEIRKVSGRGVCCRHACSTLFRK